MRFLVCCALAAFSLSGCGVMKRPLDLGGSKGDGTVILGANVGEFDRVNWDGAQSKARKRCTAWGYRDTEAFEGIRQVRRNGRRTRRAHPLWAAGQRDGVGTSACRRRDTQRDVFGRRSESAMGLERRKGHDDHQAGRERKLLQLSSRRRRRSSKSQQLVRMPPALTCMKTPLYRIPIRSNRTVTVSWFIGP